MERHELKELIVFVGLDTMYDMASTWSDGGVDRNEFEAFIAENTDIQNAADVLVDNMLCRAREFGNAKYLRSHGFRPAHRITAK